MFRRRTLSHSVLRTGAIALLLIGLLTRPVLALVGEVHMLDLAVHALAEGQPLQYGHAHDLSQFESQDRNPGEREYFKGSHSLMHLTCPVASIDGKFDTTLLVGPVTCLLITPPPDAESPLRNVAVPFRPPIF